MDLKLSDKGDLLIAPNGDLAVTSSTWEEDGQQIYVRLMTEAGDWTIYPLLGASLSQLFGLPQSAVTGEYGKTLIQAALAREGRFIGRNVTVEAVPVSAQIIRFDVSLASGSLEEIQISVERDLTLGG